MLLVQMFLIGPMFFDCPPVGNGHGQAVTHLSVKPKRILANILWITTTGTGHIREMVGLLLL
jgi:hypothetical protein